MRRVGFKNLQEGPHAKAPRAQRGRFARVLGFLFGTCGAVGGEPCVPLAQAVGLITGRMPVLRVPAFAHKFEFPPARTYLRMRRADAPGLASRGKLFENCE